MASILIAEVVQSKASPSENEHSGLTGLKIKNFMLRVICNLVYSVVGK